MPILETLIAATITSGQTAALAVMIAAVAILAERSVAIYRHLTSKRPPAPLDMSAVPTRAELHTLKSDTINRIAVMDGRVDKLEKEIGREFKIFNRALGRIEGALGTKE